MPPAQLKSSDSTRNSNVRGKAVRTGIQPLDTRLGGLQSGAGYLLAGVPGSGRFPFLLQFLSAGLDEGRVGLISAASRERVFDEARHWGFGLDDAWKRGRMGFLSYKADFQRRMFSAADPGEVLDEMGELLGPGIRRLAIYPATPLWEARAGTSLASNFIRWTESFGATTLATIGGDLDNQLSPASEWIAEAVAGVFLLEKRSNGLHQVVVRRMTPPRNDPGAITMDLSPGHGFVAASDRLDRRSTDPSAGSERRVLLLRLGSEVPAEMAAWLDRWYDTETISAPLSAVARVQAERFGLVLIYLSQSTVGEAFEALRALRGLTNAPILLATDEAVRATDRSRALEAGARDFVSGPLNVAELASRAEKAIIAGSMPRPRVARDGAAPSRAEKAVGDPAEAGASFAEVVRERLESPRESLFTFLQILVSGSAAERLHVGEVLVQEIREDAGDLTGEIPGGYGVVLQDTAVTDAGRFLKRVEARLAPGGASIRSEAWSGTLHGPRIREALGSGKVETP